MTHSPPSSAADPTPPPRERAAAAFNPDSAPREWLEDKARLAILFPPGSVVNASPAMLDLFGAGDCEELEARLMRGKGPTARRLRCLAATLPLGEPRLEPIRLAVERPRPASVNLRCLRVRASGGETWLLATAPALGAASTEPPAATAEREMPRQSRRSGPDLSPTTPSARFLWTLDEETRFGAADPALAAAVGDSAPRSGEAVEAFFGRAGLNGADALLRVLGERRTFSEFTLEWPISGDGRFRPVALSAAPLFGRHREFLGYRGFGLLGEEIAAAEPAAFESQSTPAADGVEAEARAGEIAAEPVEQFAPADVSAAQASAETPLQADEGRAALAALERARAALMGALEPATQALAPPSETMEPDLSATDAPEASFAADGDKGALADSGERPGPGEAAAASPERTAEIYVLRHPAPAVLSNIVPIRPGALDALAREPAQSFPAESVELSRSERDAFREIARALVGHAPASRDDPADERTEADLAREVADLAREIEARVGQGTDPADERRPSPGAASEQVQRNASAILDRLPVGVLVARDGRALYANRTLLDLVGYPGFAEFQAANGLSKIFRDRDPQGMTAEDPGAVAIVRADGQILSVDGHAQAIGWDGAPATLIALRRSLEAELRARMRAAEGEAPARSGLAGDLQAMLDRATDGAVTLDAAGRILSLNEAAERLFGYHQNEIAGESALMLLAPHSHPETTARLESLSRGGDIEAAVRPLQVIGRDRNGASIPLALTLARIGPGEAPQFCALARDLSRERETERRLIAARDAADAASAAKTDFLAQVSHEIRTPLHAILGFAEVMLEERFGPIGNERYKDYLKDIHTSGAHVMSLADDLLDLSKIEAGKFELAFASVDANSVIRECVSLMQPQAARERVIMRVSLHDRLPRVMVDERSLRQIMLNLMSNAVKFNEPGGQVIVSTAVDAAGQAVIRVRDTGVGMNESEVGLALTPFSQVGKTGGKGGAGLGLPLTKALVEANKAEFSIKSRREQGTLIEIAFPNVQAAQ